MNRELKFRAWHNNKMIYNCAVINGKLAIEENPIDSKEIINGNDHYYNDWATYKIYNSPIMQYTELKDKNNNKIFEGDKVKAYGEIYTIEFELGSFIFIRKEIVKHHTNEYRLNWRSVSNNAGDYREWEECRNNYEIIGNIYKEEK